MERFHEDKVLAARALQGDIRARREILQRIWPRVEAAVRHLAARQDLREDSMQDVILEVLRSLPRYRGEASLETWGDAIAVRTMRKKLRSYRVRKIVGALDQEPTSSAPTPEQELERLEVADRLAGHLASLTPPLAEALVLRLVLGHSVEEAARLAGTKVNTFRDRLRRARAALRASVLADPVLADTLGKRDAGHV